MTYDELFETLSSFLSVTDRERKALLEYASFLKRKNEELNLTSIVDDGEIAIKHFYDSLYPLKFHEIHGKKCLDFGSGAGFPGLPLALFNPDADFTLLDATAKKCRFLEETVSLLSLTNAQVLNARGENLPKSLYDVIYARAVAPLSVLLEMIVPLLKEGGSFVALKGKGGKEELALSSNAIHLLGVKLTKCEEYELPEKMGARTLLIFQKTKKTPKRYPRPYAEIAKHPL